METTAGSTASTPPVSGGVTPPPSSSPPAGSTPPAGGGSVPPAGGSGGGWTPPPGGEGGGWTPPPGREGGGWTPPPGGGGGGWTPPPGGGWIPPTGPPPSGGPAPRVLRRSRTNRFAAGVSGGLGEYFGVDPVLFRVLFATSAFFGGFGVLAYLLAWAAIPEQGTAHAAVDRWIADLRRWRVPAWIVVLVGVLIVWGVSFSWWAPRPFVPLLVIAIVVILVLSLRGRSTTPTAGPVGDPGTPGGPPGGPGGAYFATAPGAPAASAAPPASATPGYSQQGPGTTASFAAAAAADSAQTSWEDTQSRQWLSESQQRARTRRIRSRPILLGTLGALAIGLIALIVADIAHGIVIPAYFWVTGGIVLTGLIVGAVLRRTPWVLSVLLIPAVAGMIAFGNTGASLHDGSGQQEWVPTATSSTHLDYRLAFGQGTLDLRQVNPSTVARTIDVTMASGQVRVLLPATMNASVHANVRLGEIEVDGALAAQTNGSSIDRFGGYDINHTVLPPPNATGAPVTVTVHLANGQVEIRHTS